jgi:hypothetical protein
MTENDLLTNARELLRLASTAIGAGQIAVAKGLTTLASRYLEDAEAIGGRKRRTDPEDKAA